MSTTKLGVRHLCFFHLTESPKTGAEALGYSLWFGEKPLTSTQRNGLCFSCPLKTGIISESSFATIKINKTFQFCNHSLPINVAIIAFALIYLIIWTMEHDCDV